MENFKETGLLALRAFIMPKELNAHNTVFGGALLAYFDQAGALVANNYSNKPTMLVGVDKTSFKKPVFSAEELSIYGKVSRVGNTSISVDLQMWSRNLRDKDSHLVATSTCSYVAVDKNLKPTPIKD